ncbi:MAG: S26 family signal peptidase [Bacteroidia bacterium]|nr:S26 family signal peptidase [Bacteroidia bacterium]
MEEKKDEKKFRKIIPAFTLLLLLFFLFFYFMQNFFILKIESPAMMPSLEPGKKYWFRKNTDEIRTGDIVAYFGDDSSLCVSRVLGQSGDTVCFKNGWSVRPMMDNPDKLYTDFFLQVPKKSGIKKILQKYRLRYFEILTDSIFNVNTDSTTMADISTKIQGLIYERKLMEPKEFDREIWQELKEKKFNRDHFIYVVSFDSVDKEIKYFLVNDNRSHALDSRFRGPVNKNRIIGVYAGF